MIKKIYPQWAGNNCQIFAEGGSGHLQAYLDFAKYFTTDALLADAFKKSADAILSHIETGRCSERADMYFFPVSYLYRHAIELYLKQLIQHGVQLSILEDSTVISSYYAIFLVEPLCLRSFCLR